MFFVFRYTIVGFLLTITCQVVTMASGPRNGFRYSVRCGSDSGSPILITSTDIVRCGSGSGSPILRSFVVSSFKSASGLRFSVLRRSIVAKNFDFKIFSATLRSGSLSLELCHWILILVSFLSLAWTSPLSARIFPFRLNNMSRKLL